MVTVKRFGLLLVQYPHTCLVPWTLGKVKNGRENNSFESKRKKKKELLRKGKKRGLTQSTPSGDGRWCWTNREGCYGTTAWVKFISEPHLILEDGDGNALRSGGNL